MTGTDPTLRADKWLWHCRFFKSRTLAAKLCNSGRLRINGTIVRKAHEPVRRDDVLTFPVGRTIRVVRVAGLGTRRGPAAEAQALYVDLSPEAKREGDGDPKPQLAMELAKREKGDGRPTKAQRRAIERLQGHT